MEIGSENLEKGEVEENICSECGTVLDDGDSWPPARVENAGTSDGGELVDVTFQAMQAVINIARGISEVSWRYENLGDYIRRALLRQNDRQVAILQERDNLLNIIRDRGEEAAVDFVIDRVGRMELCQDDKAHVGGFLGKLAGEVTKRKVQQIGVDLPDL